MYQAKNVCIFTEQRRILALNENLVSPPSQTVEDGAMSHEHNLLQGNGVERGGTGARHSSRGPVSVSMLLLSVSEAKVCSVDMDEMSLAEDD